MGTENVDAVVLHDVFLENNGDSSRESGIDDAPPSESAVNAKAENGLSDKHDIKNTEGDICRLPDLRTGSDKEDAESSPTSGPHPKDCDDSRKGVKSQNFDRELTQQRRREQTLQWQKKRRDVILEKIRQLEDSAFSDSETEDEMDFVASVREKVGSPQFLQGIDEEVTPGSESMEVVPCTSQTRPSKKKNQQRRKRYKQGPCRPMLSEWMFEVPDDFEQNWIGVVCPQGRRCIVMASRGKTKVYSRSDQYLGTYKSLLPGGCKYHYSNTSTSRNRGVTILDCIWSELTQTFYVLDLICWNSHSCINCDTDYRQFFLHSKFSENLGLLESSPTNPFPFRPLIFFAASELATVLASPIMFSEDIDGILFFHKEAFYISETNPLCLWILLTQVESVLNMYVAPELLSRQVEAKNLKSRNRQSNSRNRGALQEGV